MEVAFNEFFQFGGAVFHFLTQVAVVKVAQLFDDTVNHSGREHAMSLVHLALTFQAIGRGNATVGQLSKAAQLIGICSIVNVHINVSLLCNFECVGQFKAITAANTQAICEYIKMRAGDSASR